MTQNTYNYQVEDQSLPNQPFSLSKALDELLTQGALVLCMRSLSPDLLYIKSAPDSGTSFFDAVLKSSISDKYAGEIHS